MSVGTSLSSETHLQYYGFGAAEQSRPEAQPSISISSISPYTEQRKIFGAKEALSKLMLSRM